VTDVGGPLRFVRLALKAVTKNDRDFVDVFVPYIGIRSSEELVASIFRIKS
jgi:hypothetical protein